MGKCCKIIPVKNRLGQLLRTPGGIARGEAVAAAGTAVETLRAEYVNAIPGEIGALESIVMASGRRQIPVSQLKAMLDRAGRLLTLSGTFGFDLLDEVVKRFCDLVVGMIEKDIGDAAPVDVHLRAMRLVCPGGPELGENEADHMLSGLERVHTHYGIQRLHPELAEQQPQVE
ncbi:MAG TPA: hypothetical protein VMU01_08180 [Rhizomicrobium sp.]|nr:hypothetical protein [Rhizomicrobium sp.]